MSRKPASNDYFMNLYIIWSIKSPKILRNISFLKSKVIYFISYPHNIEAGDRGCFAFQLEKYLKR